ncbi:MAG: hypothetical protein ACE5ED_05840 [Rhodothalassiaceae bacterium]
MADALTRFAQAQAPGSQRIGARDISISAGEQATVTVRFGYETRDYRGAELTAALIHYAKVIGLPVARSARKAVAGVGGAIVLKLWIG